MKLILSFVVSLFIVTTLSANCGMKGAHNTQGQEIKCDKEDCSKKQMKKEHCKMEMKKNSNKMAGSCGAGKCGAGMKKQASCGTGKCGSAMKKAKCDMPKCDMKMAKKHQDMKSKCDCKNDGNCKCKASGKAECKCEKKEMKKDSKFCGCGMTKESCKEMMSYCKFRDGEKKDKK